MWMKNATHRLTLTFESYYLRNEGLNNEFFNQIPSSLILFLLNLQCQGRGCGWLGPGLHQSVEAGLAAEERLVAGDLGPDKDTRGRVVRPEADLANVNVSQDTAAPQQHQLQQQHLSGHMLLISTFSELPFPDFLVLWCSSGGGGTFCTYIICSRSPS